MTNDIYLCLIDNCYAKKEELHSFPFELVVDNEKYNCLACEMESFALFHNANILNKKATCLITISDSLVTKKQTTSEERQNSFNKMIELALDSAIQL